MNIDSCFKKSEHEEIMDELRVLRLEVAHLKQQYVPYVPPCYPDQYPWNVPYYTYIYPDDYNTGVPAYIYPDNKTITGDTVSA